MQAFGFQVLLFALICWSMAREMRRHPESGFFRPVILGFAPIFLICVASFTAIQGMKADELAKAKEGLAAQMSSLLQGGSGAKSFSTEELQAITEISLKLQPAAVSIFWLGLLTVAAMVLRRRLAKRGLSKPSPPLSRWKSPDLMIWLLFAPAALLLLDQRHWLGEVEGWISDLSLNVVIVMLTVYLFQGMMVLLEKISRLGLPKLVASLMLFSGLILAALPAGRGIALGFLALGILDTWFDFRKLNPKQNDSERSNS